MFITPKNTDIQGIKQRRFEQQMSIGTIPIGETKITTKKRSGAYPGTKGWRKKDEWYRKIKNSMRAVGKATSSGGQGKEQRVKRAVRYYLTQARALQDKLKHSDFPVIDELDLLLLECLIGYMTFSDKFIDLLDRRVLKGEKIPHDEKVFSIFERYTEWVKKGKMSPNVELGKKLVITTDQYNLIVDYQIMENQSDVEMVEPIAERLTPRYNILSWSFDKGFWHKENKALLSKHVDQVILTKKEKRNKQEQAERELSSDPGESSRV